MTQKIKVVNVRLPDQIISWLDSLVKEGVFDSRSEAIRNFVREYVKTNRT
ncbi:ribbon-helix-helix protein, CopG family [Candidatus Woesearchaeota archaeon]|nr:MAG: hypothetical protein QS99_C0015G0034 [archaeon GW2011_AR4]MBS3130119.1 ribbon-helix-helix protein, CopG family [Candidatus Woesearchaeota archaeon]HIH38736.1 ribbon-helix-helix protein, CopG family [Candidatus Woesearchaeota archaeon]HIJ03622.1 ribbon-helix-helix protein, CopG family [Candidatus Woesearchaeota archaeon]